MAKQKPKQEKTPPMKERKNTKDRKGGAKVRKALPDRRLRDAVGFFEAVAETVHDDRRHKAQVHNERVKANPAAIMDGDGYNRYLQGTRRQLPSRKKLLNLLMPNARF